MTQDSLPLWASVSYYEKSGAAKAFLSIWKMLGVVCCKPSLRRRKLGGTGRKDDLAKRKSAQKASGKSLPSALCPGVTC